jgi:excinuclease UvrABC ATPase subunit
MSTAKRAGPQPPELHVADYHDLIRVHGARVNNLKGVSVELPKRRLTVFGTIAAESQRMINETYSAFVVSAVCRAKRARSMRSHRCC